MWSGCSAVIARRSCNICRIGWELRGKWPDEFVSGRAREGPGGRSLAVERELEALVPETGNQGDGESAFHSGESINYPGNQWIRAPSSGSTERAWRSATRATRRRTSRT